MLSLRAILIAGLALNTKAADWNYGDKGPSQWPTLFPEYCAGTSQSPIDLDSKIAVTAATDPGAITFSGYDTKDKGQITNNGHSVVFSFPSGFAPTIKGGRLPAGDTFQFLSLHWHWGADSRTGSEHTMDGTEYPLEIHIIHWNMKYGSFAEAIKYSDGLAVLGFFYEVSTADNGNLAPILAKFSSVALTRSQLKRINKKKKTSKGQLRKAPDVNFFCDYHVPYQHPDCANQNADADANTAALDGTFSLNQFLPTTGAGDDYFYYSGGLTTPACNEIVLWTNFVSKNKISETQLALFRSLKDGLGAGTAIVDNYRPPQALNGRTISKRSASSTTAATSSSVSGLTIGAAIGAVVMYFVLGSGILTQLLPPTQNQRSYREYYNPVPQSLNQNYRTY